MSESHAPVLVRMEIELKAALQRQATLHGRTLTGEINLRLRESLKDQPTPAPGIAPAPTKGKALPPSYLEAHHVTVGTIERSGPGDISLALSPTDHAMLHVFRALPVEKQLALLSLFR